ncbi:hypothetical protein [Mesorhizobium sp. LjNodule214]|uniref:hypothetical protein n=1 Tax=Mesorhizobium sp. LjNodule214 TaxID=3342252 RepID=UPI003ECC40FE
MKITRIERVESFSDRTWLATFDVELDDGTRFVDLALVQTDGRREIARRENLSPVIAKRIAAAASVEYDRLPD